jgi:hexosaminidase
MVTMVFPILTRMVVIGAVLAGPWTALSQENTLMMNLMPVPWKVSPETGKLRLNENFSIGAIGERGDRTLKAAVRFMSRLAGRTGLFFKQDFPFELARSTQATILTRSDRLGRLDPAEDESYSLTVSPDRIMIVAPNDLGVLHGYETLLQLVSTDDQGFYIPCLKIEDRPRFAWRGLLIDAGRHFMPVDVIRRNLDGMAALKMNVLHWHLTEDQGFRVESKVFPQLHQLGSDGFYYSQDQIREVIAYAADRGIRVMPEFDIPGHSTSWFVAFPKYASAPGPYRIERDWGVFDPTFNPADENVYRFFDKFLEEMAKLFPDPFIHIGGDENTGKQWDANPAILAFKAEKGLRDNHALQAYFNGRILQILTKHGKKMVGWDEIFQPTLPPDIVIQSWRGWQALADAAKRGYRTILSNGYYIDHCQPASFHYQNDPLPEQAGLNEDERKRILGGEATMWSEWVSPETIDSRIWPRTAAIAERLWSPAAVKDVDDMYRRLDMVGLQLEELGLTHFKNQEMMLRRLAGTPDIGPLRTLADVVEPVKMLKRQSQGLAYTQLSPLTKFVDAVHPESRTCRLFNKNVETFLKTRNRSLADQLIVQLQRWRANHQLLRPLIRLSPSLSEIEPVSADLATVANMGVQALDAILAKTVGDKTWVDECQTALDAAKKPKAQTELPIVTAVEKLIAATLDK